MAEAAATGDQQQLDEVVQFTSELIQFDTTNHGGGQGNERPAAEYAAAKLAEVGIESTILEKAPGRSNVVARIPGSDPSADALLVHGHLDVVPADPADWTVDPFSGEIRDGVVWGRGAIDMKNMDAMILATVRHWKRHGIQPRRDIVIAFTADEEASAEYGAEFLAEEHKELFEGCTEGISESGGYTFHADNGMRIYPIGAGERGTAWLNLTAEGRAGHGSKANPDNAVSHMSDTMLRLANHKWPVRLSPTVRAALTELGKLYNVDIDFDDPNFDVDAVIDQFGNARRLVESTVRNSTNPTVFKAGYKVNVIPERAYAQVDGRMVPGAEDEFIAAMNELTGPRVDWEFYHREVPLTAPVDSPTFNAICAAVKRFDPDGHPIPICLSGGTDAKQFSRLGITGYGFSPVKMPPGFDFQWLFHGVDERVPVEALHFGVQVLDDFLRKA